MIPWGPWWAWVVLVVVLGWYAVMLMGPHRRTQRRRIRYLRRKYPMAAERDLRRMGGRR